MPEGMKGNHFKSLECSGSVGFRTSSLQSYSESLTVGSQAIIENAPPPPPNLYPPRLRTLSRWPGLPTPR